MSGSQQNIKTMKPQSKAKAARLILGNEAIAEAAIEAGVNYAAGYPGTPSSEIIQTLANQAEKFNLRVEWSTNEKVAAEGAAAAAVAGLRSLVSMKNAGLSVALDFLTHLSLTGIGKRGGSMVVVVCDDPDAHSSGDETDSRWLSRFSYAPMLEPSSIDEAKRIISWAFHLSQEFACHVMVRSYTRLSHASALVKPGKKARHKAKPATDSSLSLTPYLARPAHGRTLARLAIFLTYFENSPYNAYEGPDDPDLIVVASGSGVNCARDAIDIMGLENKIGLLKIVTIWPFPESLILKILPKAKRVLVAEEVDPYLEVHVNAALNRCDGRRIKVFGRETGHIEPYGEITPERVCTAIAQILRVKFRLRSSEYQAQIDTNAEPLLINRGLSWCPGCPHRASFWAIERAIKKDGRDAYIIGDIGCYTLDVFPGGKGQMKLLHAMGSGAGLASGLGRLTSFGYKQPIISICGDSTFFHASMPALINAVHNDSHFVQVILDNEATAMTGFQPHPGISLNAVGQPAPRIKMEDLCQAMGAQVVVADPFDLKETTRIMRDLLRRDQGVQVLILRRTCELLRMKQTRKIPFSVSIDPERCRGRKCGFCLQQFQCPAFDIKLETEQPYIRSDMCSGCGVCVQICPSKAILKKEQIQY